MKTIINKFIDWTSEYFAYRKGLLLILGIVFVLINWLLQFFPNLGWISTTDTFLHLGVVVAIFGILLAWAL
jgi:hypothetical protein